MKKVITFSFLFIIHGFLVMYAYAATPPSSLVFLRNLAVPMRGNDVSTLQQFLITKGYLSISKPTGYFGKLTFSAVIKWQKDVGLPQTGFFGPLSRAEIKTKPSVSLNITNKIPPMGSVSSAQRLLATLYFTQTASCPTTIPNNSFLGCYYDNSDLTGFIGSGIENTINFNFGTSSPNSSIGEDTFSARWEGDFTFQSGRYTFSVIGDDGVRLYIDNILVINKWIPQYPTTYTNTQTITEGTHRIRLEYYEKTGGAVAKLSWVQTETPTPVSFLTPPTNPPSSPSIPPSTPSTIIPGPLPILPQTSPSTPPSPTAIPTSTPSTTIPGPLPIISLTPATTTPIVNKFTIGQRVVTTANIKVRASGSLAGTFLKTENIGVLGNVLAGPVSQGGYRWWKINYDSGTVGWSTDNFLTAKVTIPIPSPSPITSPSTSTSTSKGFGFSVANYLLALDSIKMNQELAAMKALGVNWLRFDMQWRSVQYKNDPNLSDWGQIDRLVDAANAHNIKILGILGFAPTWAYSSECSKDIHCPPADLDAFAAFAKKVVQRYSPKGVSNWEIWNEPNNAVFWGPKINCSVYTNLLKLTYTAIKEVNPKATVITGGLAPAPTDGTHMAPVDFLSCIYANGGKNYFDAVGAHPYTFPIVPSSQFSHAWAQMSTTNPSLRSIMINNGDAFKKIWLTEFGAPTNGPDSRWYITETKQSEMITDAVNLYKKYDWAGPIFFYTFRDLGTSTTTMENFFGVTRFDGSSKSANSTLKDIITNGL